MSNECGLPNSYVSVNSDELKEHIYKFLQAKILPFRKKTIETFNEEKRYVKINRNWTNFCLGKKSYIRQLTLDDFDIEWISTPEEETMRSILSPFLVNERNVIVENWKKEIKGNYWASLPAWIYRIDGLFKWTSYYYKDLYFEYIKLKQYKSSKTIFINTELLADCGLP